MTICGEIRKEFLYSLPNEQISRNNEGMIKILINDEDARARLREFLYA